MSTKTRKVSCFKKYNISLILKTNKRLHMQCTVPSEPSKRKRFSNYSTYLF